MSRTRKLILGTSVALALLGVVELGHYVALGPPPAPFHVARVSGTELVSDGDGMRLAHAVDPRMDVHIPAAHQLPRVIALGGSSVRNPGPDANNWPWQLQRELPEVEVVNLGSPGQTMGGVAGLMADIEALSPDLVLVYSGHNDLSQLVFSGTVSAQRDWMLPVWKVLAGSWIAYHLTPQGSADLMDPNRRAALAFADNDRALELHPDLIERYEEDLRRALERAPAPVVLSTLLRNFDQGPQGLLTKDPACQAEAETVPMNRPDRPAERAVRLEAVCGETAVGSWLMAHDALARGDDELARTLWYRSLAADPYPLRATAQTDTVIRRVAEQTGTPLVDLEARIGPLVTGDHFIDTLHPSSSGARLIASELVPVVREQLAGG